MTGDRLWTMIDGFIADELSFSDAILSAALRAARDAGLPPADVSPAQGRLLALLVRMSGARRVLEIGTLGGYSAIHMARALPADGILVSIERVPLHAQVAQATIAAAEIGDRVEIRVGPAVDSLAAMCASNEEPFDFAFIDADKANNRTYIDYCMRLCRPGATLVCDNVVRAGAILDADPDISAIGAREAIGAIGAFAGATVIQTVGVKGHDGFAMMIVP